ncbi:hypothetical protein [Bacillus paramycoides]|uniref:hypothetical protein n=1 Tax=Bacillus paramycoides TaxID=2026194 RepID=UPI00224465D9|nr:hypothetical protein [Bacillus paramycoides]
MNKSGKVYSSHKSKGIYGMLLLRSKYIRGVIKVEAETKSKIWEYVGWGAIVIVGAIATFGVMMLIFGDPKTKYKSQEVTTERQEITITNQRFTSKKA